jgi:signal peptidase I
MPEPLPSSSSTGIDATFAHETRPSQPRFFLAALLSAMLPGAGHFLVRRWRKGVFLLVTVGVWFVTYCWLRLPRTVYGAILPILALVGLCVFATWDVAYSGKHDRKKPSQWWLAVLLPVALYAATVLGNLALRAAGFRLFSVPAASMAPAIPQGSRVIADSPYYGNKRLQHGEIIVFVSPHDPQLLLVKRVIAVSGESIKVEGETVLIDGKVIAEPYVRFEGSPNELPWVVPTILPEGKLFVMGDNRSFSFDSRYKEFGLVDVSAVRGKVIYALPSWKSDLRSFD